MSLGTGDPASETGDDSLSAITLDSDLETKTKRKNVHKPPASPPKSPYYSKPRAVTSWRSLRTAAGVPLPNRVTLSPQKLWPGSSKPGPVAGTPVHREKEDMYEEIISLKKSLHLQRSDLDLLRTKVRRLEEENARKDRQIEQLLDSSRGPGSVWTPAEKRPDAGWVVNGLKQRVLRLEQQCKEKDSTISRLQADLKTTDLEEMRVAMETYYEEIHRLQALLASSEVTGKQPLLEKKPRWRRQRRLGSALLSLSRSVQELTEENQSLKQDLDRVLSHSPTGSGTEGCEEWGKPQLLRRIAELEKKLGSMEAPGPQAAEGGPLDRPALPEPSSSVARQPREPGEDSEHLRGAVRSLKGQREALRARLQERDVEVQQLLQAKAHLEKELGAMREGEAARSQREEALREEEVRALTRKVQALEVGPKGEECSPADLGAETPEQPPPSRPASGPLPPLSEPGASEEGRRHAAARVLQAHWRTCRRQKEKAALDEVATVLQAAFRGHLARMELLPSKACDSGSPSLPSQSPPSPCVLSPRVQAKDDPEQEAAIVAVQSVLRAHLARGRHSQRTCSAAPAAATGSRPPSPVLPEAPAGQEDSEASHGDTEERPAPEAAVQGPWGPRGPAALQPGPGLSPRPGLQPVAPPHGEDLCSDDSDEVVMALCPTAKKAAPLAPTAYRGAPQGDALPGEG